MSWKLKFFGVLNVIGWAVVVPLLVAALFDPFVDFRGWPGGHLLDGEEQGARLAPTDDRRAERPRRPSASGEDAREPIRIVLGPDGPVIVGSPLAPTPAGRLPLPVTPRQLTVLREGLETGGRQDARGFPQATTPGGTPPSAPQTATPPSAGGSAPAPAPAPVAPPPGRPAAPAPSAPAPTKARGRRAKKPRPVPAVPATPAQPNPGNGPATPAVPATPAQPVKSGKAAPAPKKPKPPKPSKPEPPAATLPPRDPAPSPDQGPSPEGGGGDGGNGNGNGGGNGNGNGKG